jgi:hypothetical protein
MHLWGTAALYANSLQDNAVSYIHTGTVNMHVDTLSKVALPTHTHIHKKKGLQHKFLDVTVPHRPIQRTISN